MSAYSEKLKDPRWQEIRKEVMKRDKFTCQSCGAKTGVKLNVHHCYYEGGKPPWDYPTDTLITWCEACHGGRHIIQKAFLLILARLKPSNYAKVFNQANKLLKEGNEK